jgi:hypothetical protein
VATPICLREEINSTSQTSVIQAGTLIVKPSVLLGFTEKNQRNSLWGVTYETETYVRGIPASVFTSCFYVNDINAQVGATYFVSNASLFQPSLISNESAILQIDVTVEAPSRQDSYTYHVFRYVPNPNPLEVRQALETPTGVYCPNRSPGLPVPKNIPSRVSSNFELYLPMLNSTIYSGHNLIDTEFKFTRNDLWFPDPAGSAAWIHFTEIHDFGTGLSYQYNHLNRQCSVLNISQNLNDAVPVNGRPDLLQIGNPEHLFLLDDIDYQYTGMKPCRDRVLCHVWIGEKTIANNDVEHREWYWAVSVNGETLPQWIPMKMINKHYRAGTLINIVESSHS